MFSKRSSDYSRLVIKKYLLGLRFSRARLVVYLLGADGARPCSVSLKLATFLCCLRMKFMVE